MVDTPNTSNKLLLIAIFLLAVAGAVLSYLSLEIHLLDHHRLLLKTPACSISEQFDCVSVYRSGWSSVLGVPLGLWGLLFYLGFAAAVLMCIGWTPFVVTRAVNAFFVLALGASAYSVFLFLISKLIIKKLCLFCMGMYAVNILLLLILYFGRRREGINFRIQDGFSALVKAPLGALSLLVKGPSRERAFAGAALLLTVLIAAGVFLSPGVIVSKGRAAKRAYDAAHPVDISTTQKLPFTPDLSGGALGDYAKGSDSPKVTIIEFADYQCPACRHMFLVLQDLMKQFGSDVRLIYKDYPLNNECNSGMPAKGHPHACFTAQYVRCAGEQGRFWEAQQIAFTLPELELDSNETDPRSALKKAGDGLGLDTQAMDECMASMRQVQKIQQDIRDGDAVQLDATPFILVNGNPLENTSEESLRQLLEKHTGKTESHDEP